MSFCPLLCWFVTYQFYVEFSLPKSQRNCKFWSSCGSHGHSSGSSCNTRKNPLFVHVGPSIPLCSGPLTDTCDSFRLSPSETRGVTLCGTTEGVRIGLCGWNFVCAPPCLAPLLHPTVHLSSAMVYSPVVHHSALIKCYGIFLFAESEKGTPARFFLQYTLC